VRNAFSQIGDLSVQQTSQTLLLDRFEKMRVEPSIGRAPPVVVVSVACHCHEKCRGMGSVPPKALGNTTAVHFWHCEVAQHYVGTEVTSLFEGGTTVVDRMRLMAPKANEDCQGAGSVRIVINHEHAERSGGA
jgi:hypothetical protein